MANIDKHGNIQCCCCAKFRKPESFKRYPQKPYSRVMCDSCKKRFRRELYKIQSKRISKNEKMRRCVRVLTRYHIKKGHLALTNICAECGKTLEQVRTEGGRMEIHHPMPYRYYNFIEVCAKCHRKQHPRRKRAHVNRKIYRLMYSNPEAHPRDWYMTT